MGNARRRTANRRTRATVKKKWLGERVRYKLLYNESIKSLSLIRNSSHVRARVEEEADIGARFSPVYRPVFLPSAPPSRLSLSRLAVTSPHSHLRNSPNYRLTNSLSSRSGSSLGSARRRNTRGDTRDKKKLMEHRRNDAENRRRLRIRISFRLGAKEHLPISRVATEQNSSTSSAKRENYEAGR